MLNTMPQETVVLSDFTCLDPAATLDCGQAFRWRATPDGWRGVSFGKSLTVSRTGGTVVFKGTTREDFERIWRDYFDLARDYDGLCRRFSSDPYLSRAAAMYPGLRVLRQEPWEALCSFIISQNNNIPRIKGIIERFCGLFGERLSDGCFAFPSAERIALLSPEDLVPIRAGFRAKYIVDAARKVSFGAVSLENIPRLSLDEARAELMKISGVGPKVAECALLYGFGRTEAFPVDVWVRRVMEEMYPHGLPECIRGVEGIAQQYLFHYIRMRDKTNSADDRLGRPQKELYQISVSVSDP
ncbi:MAG: DNA-3-methyladenine glycosylase 2 family protein [Oscillospiraceae bacterium]|nr:DNA-3-methyladenine glycosylase 2 family protein [Oscillospiraceae bacterium]